MRLYGAFVKHDALAGVIVFLAAGAKKAEAIIVAVPEDCWCASRVERGRSRVSAPR